MCYGEIGIFKGFVYKNGYRVPLIEVNGKVLELPIPITEDTKVGDKIMVYNSYNFEYKFETLSLFNFDTIIERLLKPLLNLNIY
ncbi:hypothetical protein [Methanocaldococcus sp.]